MAAKKTLAQLRTDLMRAKEVLEYRLHAIDNVDDENAPYVSQLQIYQAKDVVRKLRNRISQRERYDVMRSLGLVKTPYGWE